MSSTPKDTGYTPNALLREIFAMFKELYPSAQDGNITSILHKEKSVVGFQFDGIAGNEAAIKQRELMLTIHFNKNNIKSIKDKGNVVFIIENINVKELERIAVELNNKRNAKWAEKAKPVDVRPEDEARAVEQLLAQLKQGESNAPKLQTPAFDAKKQKQPVTTPTKQDTPKAKAETFFTKKKTPSSKGKPRVFKKGT